ncbi:hypothetical protein DFA_07318 [Cavenderia fasciculata]|uniref:Uncharacterized protein n=1 Tax=Cavenderia fasciculata TaxID=261658 RepID=F4PW34_CACFS|nr:uncharacterized protein DFA_07318 [Cavenderia fasciculata]EGG20198.1 hypothetical protein DFA_07318 [Cavenderia fasciculata]|eukprot:XP_004367181.1 hypothetical protein DFA_07318 [Cavenderia fasciculata]
MVNIYIYIHMDDKYFWNVYRNIFLNHCIRRYIRHEDAMFNLVVSPMKERDSFTLAKHGHYSILADRIKNNDESLIIHKVVLVGLIVSSINDDYNLVVKLLSLKFSESIVQTVIQQQQQQHIDNQQQNINNQQQQQQEDKSLNLLNEDITTECVKLDRLFVLDYLIDNGQHAISPNIVIETALKQRGSSTRVDYRTKVLHWVLKRFPTNVEQFKMKTHPLCFRVGRILETGDVSLIKAYTRATTNATVPPVYNKRFLVVLPNTIRRQYELANGNIGSTFEPTKIAVLKRHPWLLNNDDDQDVLDTLVLNQLELEYGEMKDVKRLQDIIRLELDTAVSRGGGVGRVEDIIRQIIHIKTQTSDRNKRALPSSVGLLDAVPRRNQYNTKLTGQSFTPTIYHAIISMCTLDQVKFATSLMDPTTIKQPVYQKHTFIMILGRKDSQATDVFKYLDDNDLLNTEFLFSTMMSSRFSYLRVYTPDMLKLALTKSKLFSSWSMFLPPSWSVGQSGRSSIMTRELLDFLIDNHAITHVSSKLILGLSQLRDRGLLEYLFSRFPKQQRCFVPIHQPGATTFIRLICQRFKYIQIGIRGINAIIAMNSDEMFKLVIPQLHKQDEIKLLNDGMSERQTNK